jgi:hypothetical protein
MYARIMPHALTLLAPSTVRATMAGKAMVATAQILMNVPLETTRAFSMHPALMLRGRSNATAMMVGRKMLAPAKTLTSVIKASPNAQHKRDALIQWVRTTARATEDGRVWTACYAPIKMNAWATLAIIMHALRIRLVKMSLAHTSALAMKDGMVRH